jgi:hypothetical protein
MLQKAVEDQNAMLYKMLEKVNEDRERRIREKNTALMKKIKRLERRRIAIENGEEPPIDEDDEDEMEMDEELRQQPGGGYPY